MYEFAKTCPDLPSQISDVISYSHFYTIESLLVTYLETNPCNLLCPAYFVIIIGCDFPAKTLLFKKKSKCFYERKILVTKNTNFESSIKST